MYTVVINRPAPDSEEIFQRRIAELILLSKVKPSLCDLEANLGFTLSEEERELYKINFDSYYHQINLGEGHTAEPRGCVIIQGIPEEGDLIQEYNEETDDMEEIEQDYKCNIRSYLRNYIIADETKTPSQEDMERRTAASVASAEVLLETENLESDF